MNEQSDYKAQGERLSKLRKAKGLTAEQLATAMTNAGSKVSRGAISNWERGINGIVSSKLPALANILGCSEGYLLRGELIEPDSNNSSQSQALTLQAQTATNTTPTGSTSSKSSNQITSNSTMTNTSPTPNRKPLKKSDKLQNKL